MRCYNCHEFGHVAKGCKKQRRCARYGGDHDYGKRGEGVKPKRCNCGGNHSVAFWGCEVIKREVEVQQIKVKENIMLMLSREVRGKSRIRMLSVTKEKMEVNRKNGGRFGKKKRS